MHSHRVMQHHHQACIGCMPLAIPIVSVCRQLGTCSQALMLQETRGMVPLHTCLSCQMLMQEAGSTSQRWENDKA